MTLRGQHREAIVSRPAWFILAGAYLVCLAVILRTIANANIRAALPVYLALEFLYAVLFSLLLWRPVQKLRWRHAYFAVQSLLVLALVSLGPRFDFIVTLFVLLSFQSVLVLPGRAGWLWVGTGSALTAACLMIGLGPLPGLAVALMYMVIGLVFPAYISATQQIESGLARTQALLVELRKANQQLTAMVQQGEELSAMQERSRLARQLHDSVSQTIFSIGLRARATQMLLEREPDRTRAQLQELHALTQNALAAMRGLIAELRPPQAEPAVRPTP